MFAAADWIGSTPIFYAIQPSRVTASNDAPLLANTICQPIFDSIDQNAWHYLKHLATPLAPQRSTRA